MGKKCCTKNDEMVASLVSFRNGTRHVELKCSEHGRHIMYAPKSWITIDERAIPSTSTNRQERLDRGDPINCRLCDGPGPLGIRDAICSRCRATEDGQLFSRVIKAKAKECEVSVFQLDRGAIDECIETAIQSARSEELWSS
jgi:hypothetical protein